MYHVHIIHSKKDRAAALWLTGRLKLYYRTHRSIGPAKVHLGGPLFSENPEDQNFLIILCSFHTVEDPQVAETILRFYEKEPLSHIIPYTISGIPCAPNPEDECLPRVLSQISQNDLLAVNSVVLSKRAAIQKVISTIHDIPLSILEQRNKKAQFWRSVFTGVLCLLFLAYTVWSEYSVNSHTEYYRSFTYVNGAPVGIDRLNFLERLLEDDYYRFEVYESNPISVQCVGNPEGVRSEDPAVQTFYDAIHSPRIEFTFHEIDGGPDTAVHMDSEGNVLFVMNYCGNAADFSRLPDNVDPHFLTLGEWQTDFSRCVFDYDEAGNLVSIRYFPSSSYP